MAFDANPQRAQRTDSLPSGIASAREYSEAICTPPPNGSRNTELATVFNDLAQSVERVHRLAQVLESRLVDVTIPAEPSNTVAKDPCPVYATRVATVFNEQVRILNNIAAGIDSILNRLEV